MSQENFEIVRGVRTPVAVSSENSRRSLDERILLRFPSLTRTLVAAWSRLPPRSRFRGAGLSRFVRQGCEAANRRDFDLLLLGLDPSIEFELPESQVGGYLPPDLLGVHRGHAGYLRMWKGLIEAWPDLRLDPEEIVDFGDRLLVASRILGHGRSTGIALDEPLFQVFTLRRGLVIRQKDFVDRDDALEAAGLEE